MQTIIITGRLSKDAAMRSTPNSEVCDFDVAVDQGFGERKTTNWYKCQFWGKRGSSVQPYLFKGSNVTVSGELETSEYNGKLQLGIRVNEVQLPPKPQGNRSENPNSSSQQSSGGNFGGGFGRDLDDDVPF